MQYKLFLALAGAWCAAVVTDASAQEYAIPWHTVDAGGGTSSDAGYTLSGTIGQPDAGPVLAGGGYSLTGGFWSIGAAPRCFGDFNHDGTVNTLDVLAFLNAWSAGDSSSDCNADGQINTLDVICFLNAWTAGC